MRIPKDRFTDDGTTLDFNRMSSAERLAYLDGWEKASRGSVSDHPPRFHKLTPADEVELDDYEALFRNAGSIECHMSRGVAQ